MKLLVAVDLDDDPAAVLDRALPWAERFGASVHVRAVADPGGVLQPGAGLADSYARTEWEVTQRKQLRQLAELARQVPADRSGDHGILRGQPKDVLVEARPRFDALAMGTHGHRGLARLLHGSVAEQVVHEAEGPVIVLPLASPPIPAAGPLTLVAPVDASDVDLQPAQRALRALGTAELHVLHVSSGPQARRDELLAEIERRVAEAGVSAAVHVREGSNVAQAIGDFADQHRADAIAMGHDRTATSWLRRHGVVEHLIRVASVPVWITCGGASPSS